MEKIEKNMKVKREKYLSESAINEVLNDFKDVREFVKSEGRPISCMCIMSSAGLCGNASAMDYMSMIATALLHLIKGDILDVDDLGVLFKTVLKALEKESEDKTKDETKDETEDDVKKLVSALNELKDLIKSLKDM